MAHTALQGEVLELLSSLRDFWICVDGGWGIDALLERQTRRHSDLDLIVREADVSSIEAALSRLGFCGVGQAAGVVYSKSGLFVDLHGVSFDERGYGHFKLPDEGTWPLPPAAFNAAGRIGNQPVRCLSVDAQVQCHLQGYRLTSKDRKDLLALQDRYGCVLPLSFYQNGEHLQ